MVSVDVKPNVSSIPVHCRGLVEPANSAQCAKQEANRMLWGESHPIERDTKTVVS